MMNINRLRRYGMSMLLLMGLLVSLAAPVSAHPALMPGEVNPSNEAAGSGSSQGEPQEILLGYDSSLSLPASTQATGDPYSLIMDDGYYDDRMCSDVQVQGITWNQFTPASGDFPFVLNQVSMVVGNNYAVGDPIQILIYKDIDGGDTSSGVTLLTAQNVTVQVVSAPSSSNPVTWNVFNLTTPVQLDGPGSVLVGAVIRTIKYVSGSYVCPAFIDTTTWSSKSYVGGYVSGTTPINPPDPPTMPPDDVSLTEYGSFHGNLMIRAKGYKGTLNRLPVANNQTVTTNEDTSLGITLTATDADSDPLTYSIVSQPSKGSLSGTPPSVTYIPTLNANGIDTFTFKANDGKGDSNTATVTVNITAVNDVPVASNQSVSTDKDSPLAITLGVSDPDGDPITYTILSGPTNGNLTGTGANRTYTPNTLFYGSDSFTFKGNDSKADSNTATVSITVNNVNHKPIADAKSVTTAEDTSVAVTLSGSDPEGQTITYEMVSNPSHGSLSGDMPNLTYKPAANFNGADAFVYRVYDGAVYSDNATVSITVTAVNDVPVASDQSVTTSEDTPKAITLVASDVDGDALTYTISTPGKGVLSGTAPALTYTPNLNINGSDSFTFSVSDGKGGTSNTATVSITITAVNDKPTADAKSVTTAEDTSVGITLSGSDVEGSALTYDIVSGPSHGTLTGTAPNITYNPAANYNGPDAIVYRTHDDAQYSDNATVSITVTPVNDVPVANDQTVTLEEDASTSITLTATDADSDALTYTITQTPANGTLTGTAPNLTYKPNANYYGSDTIKFKVNDTHVDSNVATVTITVSPVNDAPVADSKTITTNEDTQVDVVLTGSDVEGENLTFSVVSQPSHGTLSGTPPNLKYTPAANYHGADAFTYRAKDATTYSSNATVSITVNSINDAPVASDQSVTTSEDTAKAITLGASDADGDTLTYSYTTPSKGTLSGTAPNLTYTPTTNLNGSDSFTFYVFDGQVNSNTATVSMNITEVNDRPVADNKSVTTDEDTPVAVTLTGSDVEGSPLTFSVVSSPSNGTLSGTPPNLTYTPKANFHGADAFTYRANDGPLNSLNATVSITVNSINDVPVANDQAVSTNEDVGVSFTLTGSDSDGDALTYTLLTQPLHGTLSGTAPDLTFSPAKNYYGSDSFTFKVNDGPADSNTATVSITVNSINDAPVATNQTVITTEGIAKSFTLTVSDVENDPLTYTILTNPSNGTISGTAPDLTYTPADLYHGTDSMTYKVYDGTAYSSVATVTFSVKDVNHAPVAENQAVTADEDTPKTITLTASDVDLDPLTYAIVAGPTHGTLSGTAPDLTYTPEANYNGSDSFTFKANDTWLYSNVGTISITVNPVNDKPVADSKNVATDEDNSVAVTLSGSDIEGDSLSFEKISGPSHGTLSGIAPNLTYTPSANYNGPDAVVYRVFDGADYSSDASVNITVTPVNDAPVASGQSVTTNEDTSKDILLTGSDVDGDALTYEIVTGPAHGALSGDAPNLTYTPAANYNGSDSFTFRVNDGKVNSQEATVTITVESQNDAPVAAGQNVITSWNTAKSIVLSANDVDGDALTYVILTGVSHGSLSGDGPNWTYTPDSDYRGSDSFTFMVSDGSVNSNEATVSITIYPPTVLTANTVAENSAAGTAVGAFTPEDPDPDEIYTYALVSGEGSDDNLAFTIFGSTLQTFGDFNYEVKNNYSVRVRTTVLSGLSFETKFTILVSDVNEAPTNIALSSSGLTDRSPAGTVVGNFSAIDPDAGDSSSFRLVSGEGSGDNASFEIAGSALKTTVIADYKTKPEYSIRVKVTDAGGLSFEKVFVVAVSEIPVTGYRMLLPMLMK
jgi:hypothetical protein